MTSLRALLVGIVIGASVDTSAAQGWRLSDKPLTTVGEGDGSPEYQLNMVTHVKRLNDGRVLVVMGPELRFYDAAGKYVGKAGGRGQGPGEFGYIQGVLVLPGDTLLVLDFGKRAWLGPSGAYVRGDRVDLSPLSVGPWFSEGAMLLPNGNLLAMQYERVPPGDPRLAELHRPLLRYAILDVRAGTVTSLISSGGIRQMVLPDRHGTQPYSPHAQHAIGTDRVYVGDNDTTFVSVFTLEGRPIGRLTVASRVVPITDRDLTEYREVTLDRYKADQAARAGFERGWLAVPKPKRMPYWGRMLTDAAGNLWVSDPIRVRSTPTGWGWTIFHPDGRQIGTRRDAGEISPPGNREGLCARPRHGRAGCAVSAALPAQPGPVGLTPAQSTPGLTIRNRTT